MLGTDLSVKIPYGDGLGEVILTNQIDIEVDPARSAKFGTHGDSGSVVVNDKGEVVGLYFAGSEKSLTTPPKRASLAWPTRLRRC